jgi:hypothetical protein
MKIKKILRWIDDKIHVRKRSNNIIKMAMKYKGSMSLYILINPSLDNIFRPYVQWYSTHELLVIKNDRTQVITCRVGIMTNKHRSIFVLESDAIDELTCRFCNPNDKTEPATVLRTYLNER